MRAARWRATSTEYDDFFAPLLDAARAGVFCVDVCDFAAVADLAGAAITGGTDTVEATIAKDTASLVKKGGVAIEKGGEF